MGLSRLNSPAGGIACICAGMVAISINDMLIKFLSGNYALHQIVFVRSAIGILISLSFIQLEGGWRILKTDQPLLHTLRGVMIVIANMTFFAALAVLPLGEATALFFVAPLLITLLSVPLLGEKVGLLRFSAVIVGFIGVLIVTRPWLGDASRPAPIFVYLLPVVAALTYGLTQILTRKLGGRSAASAMAAYIQAAFIVVSLGFFIIAGDGRFAQDSDDPSLTFLLRAWIWPEGRDVWLFLGIGLNAGIIGYALSQAYRLADAAVIAPFEYIGLPLALMWGWIVWREVPDATVAIGIALILGSGLFVFLREFQQNRRLVRGRKVQGR